MYEWFEDKNFREATMVTIVQARNIIKEYEQQGYTLTLRQLYYQFVSRGLIENNIRSYKRLGSVVTDARLAGMINWESIEDRGRGVTAWMIQEIEKEAVCNVERKFALDFWQPQNVYVEVWVEKEALRSVVERPCMRWRVPYMPCKGYLSASEAWRAGKRFEDSIADHKLIIHLGDHDPSGIDMTRDNRDRIQKFAWDEDIEVRRIALNRDQIDRYNPPPNPAKMTDSRADEYIEEHGTSSWELDALEPSVIEGLIDNEIRDLIDFDLWEDTRKEEDERREVLRDVYDRFDEVAAFLKGEDDV